MVAEADTVVETRAQKSRQCGILRRSLQTSTTEWCDTSQNVSPLWQFEEQYPNRWATGKVAYGSEELAWHRAGHVLARAEQIHVRVVTFPLCA